MAGVQLGSPSNSPGRAGRGFEVGMTGVMGVFRRPRRVTLRMVRAWRSIGYAGWTSELVARFLEVFRSTLLPRLRYRKDIHLPTWSPLRYPQIWVHLPKILPQESHSFELTPSSSAFSCQATCSWVKWYIMTLSTMRVWERDAGLSVSESGGLVLTVWSWAVTGSCQASLYLSVKLG